MKKLAAVFFIFLFSFSCNVSILFAADISISTSKIQITEGETVSASIYINTAGVAINNADGTIAFPTDLLSAESVSSAGSIFSIWVQQPTFSNTNGIVSFNGGVPNPGYTGSRGLVFTTVFRAKKSGVATLSFPSVTLYANDGLGTDVTSAKTGATITIATKVIPSVPIPITTPVATTITAVPAIPIVTSKEMSDPESWYRTTDATFNWQLPSGITSVGASVGENATTTPSIVYSPAVSSKTLPKITDGTWFLHVRFKNSIGWGPTLHRKIKVDTAAPTDLEVTTTVTEDDRISLAFNAIDTTSGINYYQVMTDGLPVQKTTAKNVALVLPPLSSGEHLLTISVVDYAGNSVEKNLMITAPEIKTPTLNVVPKTIEKGQKVAISGDSYPTSDVRIWVQLADHNAKSYITTTSTHGSFNFESEALDTSGLASIWVEAMRSKTAISAPSEKAYVEVKKSAVVVVSAKLIEILSVVIPVIAVLLALLFLSIMGFHKLKKMRRKLNVDLVRTQEESHKIFEILRQDVQSSLELLQKPKIQRQLTKTELESVKQLEQDVEEAEKYFTKRLESIKKKDL